MIIKVLKPGILTSKKVRRKIVIDLAYIYFPVSITIFLYKYTGIVFLKDNSNFNVINFNTKGK